MMNAYHVLYSRRDEFSFTSTSSPRPYADRVDGQQRKERVQAQVHRVAVREGESGIVP